MKNYLKISPAALTALGLKSNPIPNRKTQKKSESTHKINIDFTFAAKLASAIQRALGGNQTYPMLMSRLLKQIRLGQVPSGTGMLTSNGAHFLKNVEFNRHLPLDSVPLQYDVEYDEENAKLKVSFRRFFPYYVFRFPDFIHEVQITLAIASFREGVLTPDVSSAPSGFIDLYEREQEAFTLELPLVKIAETFHLVALKLDSFSRHENGRFISQHKTRHCLKIIEVIN